MCLTGHQCRRGRHEFWTYASSDAAEIMTVLHFIFHSKTFLWFLCNSDDESGYSVATNLGLLHFKCVHLMDYFTEFCSAQTFVKILFVIVNKLL